jgi:hypothetical protein
VTATSDKTTARTSPGPAPTSDVSSLVDAFEDVLQCAYELDPVVLTPSTYRRGGIRRYIHRLPRPTVMLRFFIIDHARTTLDVVRRRLLARTVLGGHGDGDDRDRAVAEHKTVATYADSLPTSRRAWYTTTLIVLTIVVTRFVLTTLPGAAERLGATGSMAEIDTIDRLLDTISRTASDFSSATGLLEELVRAPLRTIAFVGTSLMTVLYVELRLFVPAFRLKRMMFNLHPAPDLVRVTPPRWGVQRANGLYALERSVERRLRGARRCEVPFDLIVPGLLLPSVLFLGGMTIEAGRADGGWDPTEPWLSYTMASAIFAGVAARLSWLARAWTRRLRPTDSLHLPSEVRISGERLIVALRDPSTILWSTIVGAGLCVGVGIAAGKLPELTASAAVRFLIFTFVIAPLWLRMNRDVSAYLRLRGEPHAGRPVLSLLAAIAAGVPASGAPTYFVVGIGLMAASVYRTCQRVQRASRIAGAPATLLPPAVLTIGFVAFPLVLAHLQRVINDIWQHAGDVVDPTPGAVLGSNA